MSRPERLICMILGLLVAAGCATPSSRIRRNPELFAGFPPEVQENVKKGKIEIGYTKEMVFIALGKPGRVYDRLTQGASAEMWSYVGMRYSSDLQPVETSYWYRDADGNLQRIYNWSWIDVGRYTEYETLRVEFETNKVRAIEILRR